MLYISSVHLFINMKENTEGWNIKKAEFWRTNTFNCGAGAGEDSWKSQGDPTSQF